MAADIVPELLEQIQRAFEGALEKDKRYGRILQKIRDGTAVMEDVHAVSVILGETLSGVLLQLFTPEAMPGGVYYWNIVERVLTATMQGNYDLLNAAASEIQKIVDAVEGLGLTPVFAPFPENRTIGLVRKIVEDPDNPTRWLGEPIVNLTESMSDDYMQENARASAQAGLEAKIVRKLGSFEIRKAKKRTYEIPCSWCEGLAGEYLYDGEQPPEIFQRHESCRCSITFRRGRLMQDVHSKRWYTDTGQALRNVKDYEPFRRTPTEARELEKALEQESKRAAKARRERLIEEYARQEEVSRRRAANRLGRAGII
ncbi:MAG: hypothetical protein IKF99_17540 [Oscillospiraceae bacterium]|nr:hypothetical protein [Oscillospiraceae bacterium]